MPKMSVCKWSGEQGSEIEKNYEKKYQCQCGKTYRHQSSLFTHKNIKHGESRKYKPLDSKKKKQRQTNGVIQKNDVQFNDKEVDLQNLSEETFLSILEKINESDLEQRINSIIRLRELQNNYEMVEFANWSESMHKGCRQKVKAIAKQQKLSQIINLVLEGRLCKNQGIDFFVVNMVWDLAKCFSNAISPIIYLDIMCHLAEKYTQNSPLRHLKDTIDQFRRKIYGNQHQTVKNLLIVYCHKWETIFNKPNAKRHSKRKGTTKKSDA